VPIVGLLTRQEAPHILRGADIARAHLTTAPWLPLAPTAVLFVIVLLTDFLGGEFQEMLEPVERGAPQ
jgi:ABC-type dipeptide/oligopeptide/nickel transport system permease subunit